MRFVIIGGDAAGMSAASRFRRSMPDAEVVVLEKSGDVSYSACGMPYNIADSEREMDDLVVRRAEVFREKQGIDLKTGHTAVGIDREGHSVEGIQSDGTPFNISYDKLLIATGASPVIPDLPGFNLPGVLALKTLENGRRIKEFIRRKEVKSVVIIGMGYIALEMCETFRERGIEVSMVKPRPIFLPWMHPDLSRVVQKEIERHDVNLHLGLNIQAIERGQNDALNVICEGIALQGDMVLVAIGVTPNSEIAAEAGLKLGPDDAISVDRHLLASDPDIYSAGDCADAYHAVTGKKTWIPLALRANRAGWAVADNLSGKDTALEGVAGTSVFKVFDLEVARTGLNAQESKDAGFDPVEVAIKTRSRAHAHPGSATIHCQMVADKTSGRLLGGQLVGIEGAVHRINALAVALHQHMTVEAFSQCDLAYAPPFGPVWDPLLTTANQLMKKI
ncbi:MAG: FAD-dependent oxidoreductase [Deltaproteobacteria bacterium]|nr:FAD-dependent oxidoreductase [Deltaproteobacteria bacterium]